jgi:hypothetical protein
MAPAAAMAGASGQSQGAEAYVDRLLRVDPAASQPAQPGAGAQAQGASDGRADRGEIARILVPVVGKGEVSDADRSYLAKVVAARTGVSQSEAERRVSEVVTEAKKAADDARRAAAKLALWIAAAMLAGAVASILGATEGGVLRDSKWYEPGWRAVRHH